MAAHGGARLTVGAPLSEGAYIMESAAAGFMNEWGSGAVLVTTVGATFDADGTAEQGLRHTMLTSYWKGG